MIQICNWLITRRCNLNCSYCRISHPVYSKMPKEYKDNPLKKEVSFKTMKRSLLKVKKHNKDAFHIFYGGEPTLRPNLLAKLVQFCNKEKIYYTIISNSTKSAQKVLLDINEKYRIQGLSASVDPLIDFSNDRGKKTSCGFAFLKKMSDVPDRVAEITVDKNGINYVVPLIEQLTDNNICASLTLVDISKTPYYDFSNVEDESCLPSKQKLEELANELMKRNDLNIHMKDKIVPALIRHYPTNFRKCFAKDIHTLTIDSDGSMRLCLRIRGIYSPYYKIENIFDSKCNLTNQFKNAIHLDLTNLCKGCNWTCPMMSSLVQSSQEITHEERRFNGTGAK